MTETIWRQYLQTQGAKFDGYRVSHYGQLAGQCQQNNNRVIPLTQYVMIVVQGSDAEKFLQGQLTCDIRRLNEHHAILGGHCNPKGRLISSFLLCALPDGKIGLRVHRSIAELALAALKKYIVFSKATVAIEPWAMLAIEGEQGAAYLKPTDSIAQQNKTTTVGDGFTCIRHNDALVELWISENKAQGHWESAVQSCTPAPSDTWDVLQIMQGIPEIRSPNSEAFLPQVLNFDALDAVSYQKGCYTGQEIIARLHYKGTAKKQLLRGQLPLSTPLPKPGQHCVSKDLQPAVGTVILSASSEQSHHILAVVPVEISEGDDTLFIDGHKQQAIQWSALL